LRGTGCKAGRRGDQGCININCPAQIKGSIEHFASKRAMDIDGLGEKLVEQLVDKNVIKDVSDLYYCRKKIF